MSVTPLSVRLRTARGDANVTYQLRNLEFSETVPGGFASARLSLDRPLTLLPDEIDYYGSVYVYDGRNGNTVWEGQLEDPHRTAGTSGQVWELTAIGPSARASDRTVPLIYVDRRLDPWVRVDNVTPGANASTATNPGDGTTNNVVQTILLQFPQGLTVAVNSRVTMRYDLLRQAGQNLGRYDYQWDAGVISTGRQVQGVTRVDGGTGENSRSENWTTAGGGLSAKVVTTDWALGRNTLDLRAFVSASTGTIGGDDNWVSVWNIAVLATRYSKAGSELSAAANYTTSTVLASDVVADLLGRLLVKYDGANASIATTSHTIEQLAYPDGTTPAQVLTDLMTLEPAYYWAAWESNAAGLNRFEWSTWPTTVRYEASIDDGFDSPGSATDLYNAVRVRYVDTGGEVRTVQRTQTVAALTGASLTREAFIDLGDNVASLADAQRAGDQFLTQHAAPPNAGTLTVARPILDIQTGRQVMPWEIRAGSLIRVRGVRPSVDSLNATDRDGVTVFRIVDRSYRASSASASLGLDSYPYTIVQSLADLHRNRPSVGPIRRR